MSDAPQPTRTSRRPLILAGVALVLVSAVLTVGLILLVVRRHARGDKPVTVVRATAATPLPLDELPRDDLFTEATPQPDRDPFSRDGVIPDAEPIEPIAPPEGPETIAPVEPTTIEPPSVAPRGEDTFEPAPEPEPDPEPVSPEPVDVPSPAVNRNREKPKPEPAIDPAVLKAADQTPPDWTGPPPPAEGGYVLAAVVLGQRPQAVVKDGDKYVRVRLGDNLGDYTVERIERGRILLRSGSHRYSLRLADEPAVGGTRQVTSPVPDTTPETPEPAAPTVVRPRRLGPLPAPPETPSGTTP